MSTELGLGDTYGQLDEPELRCECGVVADFDVEFCTNGLCLSCCDDSGECHLECIKCKRRVEAFELCECCGRCDLHDCAKDEALDRWADAKGDEMRYERAVGGAL